MLLLKDAETSNQNMQRAWVELENRHKLIEKSYESMCKKLTAKNKNQLKMPDLNQTMNPYTMYKNSPSYITNPKPSTNTK